MIVLVTGGRDFADGPAVAAALGRYSALTRIVHGGCQHGTPVKGSLYCGADGLADAWAQASRVPVVAYPVDHHLDGPWPEAGPRRNARMLLAALPDLVLAFPTPASRGTWGTVKLARQMGIAFEIPQLAQLVAAPAEVTR